MMREHFHDALPYIRNEYENAHFDPNSGMAPEELKISLQQWIGEHRDLPVPLIFSGAQAQLFAHCQIEINPHTPFSGKMNHGVVYGKDNASCGVLDLLLSDFRREALASGSPEAVKASRMGFASGATGPALDENHVCADWERVLALGPAGMRDALEERRKELSSSTGLSLRQETFFNASIESCNALLHLMERLKEEADKHGAADYASALSHLCVSAPETLYQALVLVRLYLNAVETTPSRIRTYGAVDQIWYPFYRHDLDTGLMTKEDVLELLRFFLIQTAAEQRFADQPLCLGTVNPDESEGKTDFSMLLLDAYDSLDIHNPKIHIRCPKKMNESLLLKALDMIRNGHNSIVLINDEEVYAAYERLGIPRKTAVGYLPIGCYEPVLPKLEDARICSAWINLSKPAEAALTGGENILADTPSVMLATPTDLPTFDDYLDAYDTQLRHLISFTCDALDGLYASQEKAYALPLLSASHESCLKNGLDVFQNGMEIRNLSLKCFAIGTAVDCLMAVKELLYDRHVVTREELVEILRKNWEGAEPLRRDVLASRQKWGNHNPAADAMGKHIYDVVWSEVKNRPTANGGRYRIGCDSVAQANYGHRIGALPNGRLSGELLSRNMRPTTGMDREGVTAFLQSAASLDASRFADAAPVDFWLHPTAVSGEEGLHAFAGLVNSFFAMGGFALHGNVLDTQTLRDARIHPEEHRQLQIRVCGWNEYFVNLSRELQDDFILRSQTMESA